MTPEEHIKRHRELHNALDQLLADYIRHAPDFQLKPGLGKPSVLDLVRWSNKQMSEPDHPA